MEEKDISIKEAALYLKVAENTIHRWIRQGVIPTYKINQEYRFRIAELESWAQHKGLGSFNRKQVSSDTQEEEVDLLSALNRGGVHWLKESELNALYREAVNSLEFKGDNASLYRETLINSLLERESLASTGIGNGIAIPHPRQPADWGLEQPVVGVFFLENPMDFNAVDGESVSVLFIILCSTVKGHLRMLSQVSHLLHEGRIQKFLKDNRNGDDLMAYIEEHLGEKGS